MKIAVLSGKGGAGKTFVAVNLAAAAERAAYIDCDVEEPNGRLFWKPENVSVTPVTVPLPEFDAGKCTGCKKCVEFCRFHALAYVREKPVLFSGMCHSCGGCLTVCPEGAVRETPRQIGVLEEGSRGGVKVVTGILNPGEASGIPMIRRALGCAEGLTVIDCPPGSACGVMESIADADCCVLVTEPTAFGFHNFRMVHTLAELLKKPCGVIVNKQAGPYMPLESYCREKCLPVLERIDYDPGLGKLLADNKIACEELPEYKKRFAAVLEKIGGCQ